MFGPSRGTSVPVGQRFLFCAFKPGLPLVKYYYYALFQKLFKFLVDLCHVLLYGNFMRRKPLTYEVL